MRKILCVVLALVICSFAICPSVVQAEELTDLQTQQQELQNQINDANNQLEEVQDELSENLQQVQKLDEKISSSSEELEKLNNQIAQLQTSMEDVEVKLKVAEENYNKQKHYLFDYL